MSRFNVSRAITVLAAGGALLVGALAAAPQAQAQTIHACVKKKGGAVRIVGAKTKCKKGESKMSWNTTGAAGANGLPGLPGATGAAGATGPMGPGAIKGSLFEAPKAGDPEHSVLGSGPLRLGMSCQTTSKPEALRFILYLSIPEVPTTLDSEGRWVTLTRAFNPPPTETTLEAPEEEDSSSFLFLTGPNGVPELLFLADGARTVEETTAETSAPRGCWLQAEEL